MKVMTANRLRDGAVVYFTAAKEWSLRLQEALILEDVEAIQAAERSAELDIGRRLIVGPYLFEVAEQEGGIVALSMREKIRAAHAPSVTYDQGTWQGRIG